jgi:hypothetical protein
VGAMARRLMALALALLANGAMAACAPVKVGYSNQHVPPYYMENSQVEASPPGAAVDLIRELLALHGCPMISVRLPPLRIVQALEAGTIDMAPAAAPTPEMKATVYPLDKQGALDRERSLKMYTMVFVRAEDKLARDGDPLKLLAGKKLATNFGAPYAALLRQQGFDIDDGALNMGRNFEKLLRHRVDAVIISLTAPSDMDAVLLSDHGSSIVRLEKPIRQANIWIATSRQFYTSHRDTAESIWTWLGANGRNRFAQLLKKYE